MKQKTDKKRTNDIYLLASGARGYNDEASIDKLKLYAIGSGTVRALIELLDIAPNLYFENKAVKKRVDSAIVECSTSASGLHLVALREYAKATELNKNPELSVEENNAFVKNAIRNKNLYPGIISSLQAEIINMGSTYCSTDDMMAEKLDELLKAQNIYEQSKRVLNGRNVEKSFLDARSAYLDEAKSSNLADAQVSKAKAHLIDKEYCLSSEEKGDYSLLSLSVASKISPSVEKDYFVAQCLAFDSKITESDYLRSLMNIEHEGKPSSESKREIDLGKTIDEYYKTDLTSDILLINRALNECSFKDDNTQPDSPIFGGDND